MHVTAVIKNIIFLFTAAVTSSLQSSEQNLPIQFNSSPTKTVCTLSK